MSTALYQEFQQKIANGSIVENNKISGNVHSIVYVHFVASDKAKIKAEIKAEINGYKLNSGAVALITNDNGLTFSIDGDNADLTKHILPDTQGGKSTSVSLERLLNIASGTTEDEAKFSHIKPLFRGEKGSEAAKNLHMQIELKQKHPELNAFEIYAISTKLKANPELDKDNQKVMLALIHEVKQGQVSTSEQQYTGSRPSMRPS